MHPQHAARARSGDTVTRSSPKHTHTGSLNGGGSLHSHRISPSQALPGYRFRMEITQQPALGRPGGCWSTLGCLRCY